MDKDRVVGSAKAVKGKVKEAVGKAIGDAKLEAEGKADTIEGRVQNAVGVQKMCCAGNSRQARADRLVVRHLGPRELALL